MQNKNIYVVFTNFLLILLLVYIPGTLISQQPQSRDKPLDHPNIYHYSLNRDELLKVSGNNMKKTPTIKWVVVSARDRLPVYVNSNLTNRIFLAGFLQRFEVMDKEKDKLKIRQMDVMRPRSGWVKMKDLIYLPEALKDKDTAVYQKVVFTHTYKGIDRGNIGKINFYKQPGDAGTSEVRSMGTVRLAYVYAWQNTGYGDSDFVLVGSHPSIFELLDDELTFKKKFYGWCRTDELFSWNSRIALIPNSKTKFPPYIFERRQYMERYYNLTPIPQNIGKFVTKLLFPDPVTSWQPGERPFYLRKKFEGALAMICQVGVFGAEDIEKIKREIEHLKYNSRHVDVVFLIDATQSMEPYIKGVANIVNRVMEKVKKNKDIKKLRFGAAVYRDHVDRNEKFEIRTLPVKGREEDISGVKDWLYRMSANAKSHPDDTGTAAYPEALFNGIFQAVRQSGFGKYNSKFLIIIGDAGNHSRGNDKHTTSSIGEYLASETINCMMVKVDHRVTGGAAERGAMRLFRTHSQDIRSRYIGYHKRQEGEYGFHFPERHLAGLFRFGEVDSPSQLGSRLVDDYSTGISDSVNDMIEEYQLCIDGASIVEGDTFRINPKVIKHLKERFGDRFEQILQELKQNRAYIMEFGYAKGHDPRTPHIDQFKNIYQFRKLEILTIINNLNMTLNSIERVGVPKLWKKLVRDVYDEEYDPDRTFNDYAKMRDGIPYQNLSDLFDKTQREILALSGSEIRNIRTRIRKVLANLNRIVLNEKGDRFFGPKENPYIWLYHYELP